MTPHLTHEQLCDLVLAAPSDLPERRPESGSETSHMSETSEDHLRSCLLCTAELQNLRAALSLFRNATRSYAGQQYVQSSIHKASIAPSPKYISHILYWAAAAAIAIAVLLPVGLHRRHTPAPQSAATTIASPHTTESDEALLEGIAQVISADVPSPMQPLADPTAGAAASQLTSQQRKN